MEEKAHVQVTDNSPSIERILRPITYTAWFLGVGVAHPRQCPKAITTIIRLIHMAVCSYVMIYDIQYFFNHISFINEGCKVSLYIFFLNRLMNYISTCYYIFYGIRQYTKWPELMDRLKELDHKIRNEISMNDRSIRIVEALTLFMTFTSCPMFYFIRVVYTYLSSSENIISIYDFQFYCMLAQSLINSLVFAVVVYVLYRRFQTLNKLIGQLDKLSNVQWIAFKIRRIRELHADICDLASMVNDTHSLHLLFYSGNCFTMAIASLFNLIFVMKHEEWLVLISDFLYIACSMQFCLICWICTLASEESNSTGRIIYKIILNCKPVNPDKHEASNQSSPEMRSSYEDSNSEENSNCSSSHNPYVVENFLRSTLNQECVTKEVNDFSIQLQQNRIAFSACDFFEINIASYGWFVGVIVTYIIIIIQLYPDSIPIVNGHD